MSEEDHAADYLARHWQTGSSELQTRVDELLALIHSGSENLEL